MKIENKSFILFLLTFCNCLSIFNQKDIRLIHPDKVLKASFVVLKSKEYCETLIPKQNWNRIKDFVDDFLKEKQKDSSLVSVKLNTTYGIFIPAPTLTLGSQSSRTCALIEEIEAKNESNQKFPMFVNPNPYPVGFKEDEIEWK